MTRPIYSGEFTVTLDPKRRFLLPRRLFGRTDHAKEFRIAGSAGEVFVGASLLRHEHRRLYLFDVPYLMGVQISSPEVSEYAWSQLSDVNTDAQGRILLPDRLAGEMGFSEGSQMTIAGARDYATIWKPDDYRSFAEIIMKRAREEQGLWHETAWEYSISF